MSEDDTPVGDTLCDPADPLWQWLWQTTSWPHVEFAPWAAARDLGWTPMRVLDVFVDLAYRGAVTWRCWCHEYRCGHTLTEQVVFLRSRAAVLDRFVAPPAHWSWPAEPPDTPEALDEALAGVEERDHLLSTLHGRQWLRCTINVPEESDE